MGTAKLLRLIEYSLDMSYANPWIQPGLLNRSFRYPSTDLTPLNHNTRQAQAPPVSSYSSLSGALDPVSATTTSRSYSIYKHTQRKLSSSSYPYLVPHWNGPPSPNHSRSHSHLAHTYGIYTSPSGPPTRNSRPHANHQPKEPPYPTYHDPNPHPATPGPTNHVRIPQKKYVEVPAKRSSYLDPYFRRPPIRFQMTDFPELGVRIEKIQRRDIPAVVGGNDQPLNIGDREIKIRILWPGYTTEPFEKRMKTHNGTVLRDTMLMVLAKAILEFANHIQKENIPVERGYETWAIGTLPNGKKGIMGPELFITGLAHRGGSNWQPEIWAPKQ